MKAAFRGEITPANPALAQHAAPLADVSYTFTLPLATRFFSFVTGQFAFKQAT
jgi:hypothetical protein